MRHLFLFLASVITVSICSAQTPFTTLVKEPRLLRKKTNINGKEFFAAVYDTLLIKNFFNDENFTEKENFTVSEKQDLQFFKNNSLSLNLADKGENRVSLNSEVVHYKLYIANPTESNSYRYHKYNIPLLLISKISTSNDSISKSSAYDILDYNGSPITLRIMPSMKSNFSSISDVIYYGFYTDLRGIQTSPDKLDLSYIWSSGMGITYQGDSEGAKVNESGDYIQGRYSLSVIYQIATGNQTLITSLFDTEKKYISALQGIFVIKLGQENPINLRVGYQYYYAPILNGSRSNFSIALGI